MGRPKGSTSSKPNRYWSKEAKLTIIKRVLTGKMSAEEAGREDAVGSSMIRRWIQQYHEGGEAALENKKKPGNPLSRYARRKELTPMEQLEYENMKLKIENLRLKKGYTNEEADQAKERRSGKNLKSSKS